MSQSGQLIYYTRKAIQRPGEAVRDLLRLSGCREVYWVYRSRDEVRDWENLQAELISHDPPTLAFWDGPVEDECLGRHLSPEPVPNMYSEGSTLRVTVGPCPFANRVETAIKTGIPERIRDFFLPCELRFEIGYHDLYETAEHPEGYLFARAFLSVQFWSYGTPNEWDLMRESVAALPELLPIRSELERIAGPLESCMYWEI